MISQLQQVEDDMEEAYHTKEWFDALALVAESLRTYLDTPILEDSDNARDYIDRLLSWCYNRGVDDGAGRLHTKHCNGLLPRDD